MMAFSNSQAKLTAYINFIKDIATRDVGLSIVLSDYD